MAVILTGLHKVAEKHTDIMRISCQYVPHGDAEKRRMQ
jgi:hypothetical protein